MTEKGRSIVGVAASTHRLYDWIKRYAQTPLFIKSSPKKTQRSVDSKKLQRMTEDRDILNKAAVYLTRQSD